MPAVQKRSDAADRCSSGGRSNGRMGQLMSDPLSYASASRGFPDAHVCAEVCLDPVSAVQRGVCITPENAVFLGFTPCNTHPTRFSNLHSFPSPILSRLLHQSRDLPKHIARGILQRL